MLLSNRSAAHARAGDWAKALDDADACVRHNAGWARGHSRRGTALEGLGRLDDAIAAHELVLTLEAGNTASQQAIEALREKKRQRQGGEDDVYKGSGGSAAAPPAAHQAAHEAASAGVAAGVAAGVSAEAADPAKEAEDRLFRAQMEAEERAKAKAEKVQKWKDRGNKAVQAGNFEDAIDNYSSAIELDASNHVLYSNRAAAYVSVNQFQRHKFWKNQRPNTLTI